MTHYSYKPRTQAAACPRCVNGFGLEQRWAADALDACPDCGNRVYRVVGRVNFQFRHGMKGDCRDYREDLARFPNDPEAYVDGPRSLQKLIDQRKRDGWVEGCGWDTLHDTTAGCAVNDVDVDPMEMARECLEEAKATGFSLQDPDVQGLLDDPDPES